MLIIVECNPDEFLVRLLGFSQIKHAGGRDKVLEKVKKNYGSMGSLDEDPDTNRSPERKKYVEIETGSNIKLLSEKNDKSRKVIEICPRLEDWILIRARRNRIYPADFDLPNDPNGLRSPHVERKKNFQDFMKRFADVDSDIKTLKRWLVK